MSVARIKSPFDRFYIGQKVNVKVKSIDTKNNRIMFTYKELLGTWEEYTVGVFRNYNDFIPLATYGKTSG